MSNSGRSTGARTDRNPPGHRMLLAASAALLVSAGLHGLDHLLQERGVGALTIEFILTAVISTGCSITLAFVVVLLKHPRAPLVAAVIGAYTALVVTAVHFVPYRSAFTDPYYDLDLPAISWVAAAAEVMAAAVLAVVGAAVLRRRHTTGRPALDGVRA